MTAKVLTVAQQKGGAGKTTLAVHLGVALSALGCRLTLIDVDPQGSLTAWHHAREQARGPDGGKLDFQRLSGWRLPTTVERLAARRDIIVIDSPPHAEIDSRLAVRAADLVLVPVQPSPVDLWATGPTLELARAEGKSALLVINRMPARANLAEEMVERLAVYKIAVARTTLGNRIAFAASLNEGAGVTESAPTSPAAEEIYRLAAEVLAMLSPARSGAKVR